ncbi:Flp family type IVb pilin [Emcibacter nanhaiensis]|uniref:Flp family type IVb pilin n=1 Tax=Emcibacter nanhaiensis TaxID=1505037 RepID=A0A501PBG5_9PROT|nr:Flp family type IVb pilin [Emcibacter nanhaiensis]TPD57713.1 Flp family type IVb pilin [Emcibacter nanhaiensis]
MTKFFAKLKKSEAGATAIEYGLIAALVAVAAIAGLSAVGQSLDTTLKGVSSSLNNAG